MKHRSTIALSAFLLVCCFATAQNVPVTTKSEQARQYFEQGKHKAENLYNADALDLWRKAVAADPQFAQAYAFLALNETNPARASVAREKARVLQSSVPEGEGLLVKWAVDASDNNMLAAISEMNDLFAQYPHDKQVKFLVSNWLVNGLGQWEIAERVLGGVLAEDPDYAPAVNNYAYVETYLGKPDESFKAIEHYAQLLPTEPNPQDSWAELSRLNGNYEAAIEHYRAALKIDPKFITSQLGLGDTYAMMGDEQTARREYDKAIADAPSARERIGYRLQRALTYVREKDNAGAMRELKAIAFDSQKGRFPIEAAESHRYMAMISPQSKKAEHFAAARKALAAGEASDAERDGELAKILEFSVLQTATQNPKAAARNVAELKSLSDRTHSDVITSAYHVANAQLLLQNGKYSEAADEALEDQLAPSAHALAAKAFAAEKNPRADEERKKVAALHTQDIEYAIQTMD